jgi:glycosyltransferase involved in cell wall biosynthesis
MKIVMLAPFEEPVPPAKYGGTELVVYNLCEQLVKMGHDVTLLATGDSTTSAKLVPIFEKSLRSSPETNAIEFRDVYKYIGAGRVIDYLQKNKFDVIHNHIGWRILAMSQLLNEPTVTTLHGPLDIPSQQKVYGLFKEANYISISESQRKPMPELNFLATVYNGLDIDKFKFFPEAKDYFAFLGRMSPQKGPVQAIQIAKAAGVKLVMAAKVDIVDEKYFKEQVEPLIDGEQIKFIGEVDHAGKLELLGNARALLAPIQWEEPFGLFFVEAMACGTPVITMNRGSVPELVINEKTGFICQNEEEAIEKIKIIDTIDRKACFDHVNANFSSEKMAEGYVAAYQKAIENK